MHLSRIKIRSFRSFHEQIEVPISPGVNVIVGKNAAGKSALLDAMVQPSNEPHRSLISMPTDNTPGVPSKFSRTYAVTPTDIEDALAGPHRWLVPIEHYGTGGKSMSAADVVQALRANLQVVSITEVREHGQQNRYTVAHQDGTEHTFIGNQKIKCVDFRTNGGLNGQASTSGVVQTSAPYPVTLLTQHQKKQTYRFSASRMNIGTADAVGTAELLPDGSNLAQVLAHLQGHNRMSFREYASLVEYVLPSVRDVASELLQQKVRVWIWPVDPATKRADLRIELSKTGSGVGQVLAMLYAVTQASRRQTIMVDEPSTFLHPGATRRLLDVFQAFEHHQYIIATHSPEVISHPSVEHIVVVAKGARSAAHVQTYNAGDTAAVQASLSELGTRLSDVFGADAIVWVEGPTEEKIFPIILHKVAGVLPRGIRFLKVSNTGDLEGRHARVVASLHQRLAGSGYLLPPTVRFALDTEKKTRKQQEDFEREVAAPVAFLPRRMIENYLLHAEAISHVISSLDAEHCPEGHDVGDVQARLDHKVQGKDITKVDAAKVLAALFIEITNARVEFRKTRDSVALATWIASHDPSALDELSQWLTGEVLSAEHFFRPPRADLR